MNIPLIYDMWQEILERTDFLSQIRLTQLCKYFYDNLKIYDFLNINYQYLWLLSDNIIKNYPFIKKLYAYENTNITDAGIKHLNLHTLISPHNKKITDKGIKHMSLHTLDARYNCNITDDGIKHMNLHL